MNTIDSANNFAKNYDEYVTKRQWVGTDILFDLMDEFLKPGQTLLDIGIGTGLSSIPFKKYGLSVFGIDGAVEMLKICRKKGISNHLSLTDFTKEYLCFENKLFNHAISHGVFHLIGDLKHIFKHVSLRQKEKACFGFTFQNITNLPNDFIESPIQGVFEKKNPSSGIKTFRHSDEHIMGLLGEHDYKIMKITEFLAFVDDNTKTYFNAIVAMKK